MTLDLRGMLLVLGEGVRLPISLPSAKGSGEGSKDGVAGGGMFSINSPANIREGMRAIVPLDRLA